MKIFVTGGTGFVGQEVVKVLHASGHSVRILVRDPESPRVSELVSKYHVETQTGTVLETDAIETGVRGMNAVIHLVGIISEIGENTFENVHVRGTQNIVAAVQGAGIERLVHMSALGTRPGSSSRYHQTKWEAEQAVRQSQLDYTIFRPSLIYGPRDQFVKVFERIIRFSPVIPILGAQDVHFQPIAVEEVAAAFARSVMEPKAIGHVYDLCGPEGLTLDEIVDEICQRMGRRRFKLRTPLWLARKLAAFLEFIFPRLLRKASPLNRDQLIMLHENNLGNPEPANQIFQLRPLRFREGIRIGTQQTAKVL